MGISIEAHKQKVTKSFTCFDLVLSVLSLFYRSSFGMMPMNQFTKNAHFFRLQSSISDFYNFLHEPFDKKGKSGGGLLPKVSATSLSAYRRARICGSSSTRAQLDSSGFGDRKSHLPMAMYACDGS